MGWDLDATAHASSHFTNRTLTHDGAPNVARSDNADKLNRFFTHDLNSIYYKVEYTTVRGQPTLRFKKGASNYDLIRGSWADKLEFDWPSS